MEGHHSIQDYQSAFFDFIIQYLFKVAVVEIFNQKKVIRMLCIVAVVYRKKKLQTLQEDRFFFCLENVCCND